MDKLKSGVILNEDEKLIVELEAELYSTSPNPIAQLIGKIRKIIGLILGFKIDGFVVITDKRVVEVRRMRKCYVFNTDKEVKYLLPSSVKELGYYKETTCFVFCPAYHLYYESFTQRTSIQLTTDDEVEAQKIVDAFYKAISSAQ